MPLHNTLWIRRILLFFTLTLPLSAHAQGFTVGAASQPGVTVVTSDYVSEKALSAFESTTARLVAEGRATAKVDDPQTQQRFDKVASEIRTEFAQRLHQHLDELEGDGVLEVSEVTETLGRLHEELLGELEMMLDAIQDGHPPPPLVREYDSAWAYTKQMLDYTVKVRNAPIDWGRFALYVLGGLMLAWLISKSMDLISHALRLKPWRSMALLLESSGAPLYMVAAATGIYLGLETLWIPGIAEPMLDKIITSALIIALFWFLWGAAKALASGISWIIGKTYDTNVDHHIELFILRVLRVIVLISLAATLINVILSSGLTGLLTGLGVIGVALSFILRGSIENLAAAFTLFGDKPIRVGDLMIYKDYWGRVEDIGFRAVRFRTFDGHLFNIPNSEIIDEAIQNVGARPYIRRRFRISLTYDTPPEKVAEAMDILKDILHDHEGQPEDQPPHVLFEAYGEYDLRLLVQYYFQPPEYWDALELDSKINLQILKRFKEAGLEFAFPTNTTVLKTDPDETPELVWRDGADTDALEKPAKDNSAVDGDASPPNKRRTNPAERSRTERPNEAEHGNQDGSD